MYFLPFCSCPSYQFCLLMFCQDILVALSQLSSVSLLLPWIQSRPWCSTLFFAPLPERKRWCTRCVIAVSHFRLKTCIPGFLYKRATWSAGKIECSDTGILSPRPEGCTSISPVPGHGSSPVLHLSARLLEEQHCRWNAALKHLVLVASGQVEVDIFQRRTFTFLF